MTKKKITGFVVLIALCLGIFLFYFPLFSEDQEMLPLMATATIKDFQVTVDTVGELDAAHATLVASFLKGEKGKIIDLIEDGAHVHKGDIIVKLDPAPFERKVRELQGRLSEIQAAVEARKQLLAWEKSQVEKELETSRFGIKKAQLQLDEYKNGEGPLKLVQLKEEADEVIKKKSKYQQYLEDLNRIKAKGYAHPTEISRAEQELATLEASYQTASQKYTKYKTHIYPAMIERHSTALAQAQMELEKTMKSSVHKVAQAQSALNEYLARLSHHEQQLAEARSQLEKTRLYAPSDGIVILSEAFRDGQHRKPRIGDLVLHSQPIVYLPDISSMIVNTRVREIDLHKVVTGQECLVWVDAYPEKHLKGKVSFIGALAAASLNNSAEGKYFKMTVRLEGEDLDLRPGMTARIQIMAATVTDALTIPVAALFGTMDKPWCYRYHGPEGGFEKCSVRVGRKNRDWVEILAGLEEGDQVATMIPEGY